MLTRRTMRAACAALVVTAGTSVALTQVEVIYSEVSGDPSATVPGALDAAGLPVATEWNTITDLTPNADWTEWMIRGTTTQPSSESQIMILGAGTAGTMFVQEGQPAPGGLPGEIFNFFDSYPSCGFNASTGDIAFTGRIGDGPFPAPNDREAIYTWDSTSGTFTLFLTEGDPLFGLDDTGVTGDETLGNSASGISYLNDGTIRYYVTPLGNTSALRYPAIMIDDGPAFLQSGVDTMTDLFANVETWDSFDLGDFSATPDGLHYFVQGDHEGSTASDDVLVVDDVVVMQEGVFLPGTTEVASSAIRTKMISTGDWFSTGNLDPTGDGDFALRNGSIVAITGDPVPGAPGESWGTSIPGCVGNTAGSYVVIGKTDNPDPSFDDVVVWEDIGVVLREGDPVDLDGNGMFDDDTFHGVFNSTSFFLDDNFTLSFLGKLRDGAGTDLGDAFMRTSLITANPGDIAVEITDAPDPIGSVGDDLTYTVRVTNASPTDANNVVVTTTLDANTAFLSSTVGSHAAGTHTAMLGTIGGLSVETFEIVVDTLAFATVTATSSVTQDEADPDLSNNSASANTDVVALADLTVGLDDTPDPVTAVGGQITYTVTAFNTGPADATNTTATLTLPPETSFVSTSVGSHSAGTVTANLGTVLNGGMASFDVVVDTSVNGTYSASASVDSDEGDPTPADATTIEATDVTIESDIEVTLTDSSDPVVGIGTTFTYSLDLANNGPTDATGVAWSVTLPAEVTFVGSSSGTHSAGTVSGTEASILASGNAIITIDVDTNAEAGAAMASASATPTVPGDPDTANNDDTESTQIVSDLSGFAQVKLADVNFGLPSSEVPGFPGRGISSFSDRPAASSDGRYVILTLDADGSSADDEFIVVLDEQMGTATVVLQEGVTTLDGFPAGATNPQLSINNAGQFAFANNTGGPTSADELIVRGDLGGTFEVIAREGDPAPDALGSYGSTNESASIDESGTVYFLADTTFATTTEDEIFASSDGTTTTLLLREGVSIPAGQDSGTVNEWDEFDSNTTNRGGVLVSADGSTTMALGDLLGDTSTDDVLVVNNTVVVQENIAFAPFVSTADSFSPIDGYYLAPNGDWYAVGNNNDGVVWALGNGALLAQSGDELFPGSGEAWGTPSSSFEFVAADTDGNFVLCGESDSPDSSADIVIVLNNERLIAREGDPVDLDGNGLFDDDAFISLFDDDDAFIANGNLYAVIDINGATTGDAFVCWDLGLDTCPCEFGGDPGMVDVTDLLEFLSLWFVNDAGADINGGGVDVTDLLDFLACWFPSSNGADCP